uniref:Uncharacterized protein n=1 Tax=Oryza brachyantha TaxID=4533 RepID=J3L6D9_ORYBR
MNRKRSRTVTSWRSASAQYRAIVFCRGVRMGCRCEKYSDSCILESISTASWNTIIVTTAHCIRHGESSHFYTSTTRDRGSPAAEAAAMAPAAHLAVVVLDDEMVPLPADRDCDVNEMRRLYIKSNSPTILAKANAVTEENEKIQDKLLLETDKTPNAHFSPLFAKKSELFYVVKSWELHSKTAEKPSQIIYQRHYLEKIKVK